MTECACMGGLGLTLHYVVHHCHHCHTLCLFMHTPNSPCRYAVCCMVLRWVPSVFQRSGSTVEEWITRIPSGISSRLYGSFPSALNTWSKVWHWILIWAYLIWKFAPIFGQQNINFIPPPRLTFDFLVRLGLNFYPMGELGVGVDWASDTFFVTDGQKRDYLSRASHAAVSPPPPSK